MFWGGEWEGGRSLPFRIRQIGPKRDKLCTIPIPVPSRWELNLNVPLFRFPRREYVVGRGLRDSDKQMVDWFWLRYTPKPSLAIPTETEFDLILGY